MLAHASISANGEGHSWNRFWCATPPPWAAADADSSSPWNFEAAVSGGSPSRRHLLDNSTSNSNTTTTTNAAGIVLTTIRPLTIEVDEPAAAVTVGAGVKVSTLLDYLAAYVTPTAPSGWTLVAPPWFVYQSIGGAVATATHGSNLEAGSLSSAKQLVALEVVLANGTVAWFSDLTQPVLMKVLSFCVCCLLCVCCVPVAALPLHTKLPST